MYHIVLLNHNSETFHICTVQLSGFQHAPSILKLLYMVESRLRQLKENLVIAKKETPDNKEFLGYINSEITVFESMIVDLKKE